MISFQHLLAKSSTEDSFICDADSITSSHSTPKATASSSVLVTAIRNQASPIVPSQASSTASQSGTLPLASGDSHMAEIERKIVIRYLKSFRDEIEVGTGYDSLVKQLYYSLG